MSTAHTIIKNEKNFPKSQKTSKTPNGSVFTNGFKTKTLETTQNQKQIKNLEEQFKAACDAIQNLPKNGPFQPSNEMLLKFYAYYKQATQGPCKTSRPGIFKVVERAKYDAWDSVRHLNKEQAMQGYIDEIKKIVETMPHNEFVQKLINIIGPFYEFVDEKNEVIYQSEKENDVNDDEEEDDKESVIENKNYIISNKNVTSTLINDDISNLKISEKNLETNSPIISSNGQNISTDNIDIIHLKPLDENLSLNQNGHNGKKSLETQINGFSNNSNEITSDDDEDYCDTSDHINEQVRTL
ncbi:unnamed protein product [Brachionus calyciflorus]|uniref:ACB domain-containing protein n=1 Tax=Brachionus calyciflorus TaxID=104777 RepID=A0A814GTL3_9BILA|nr:unnamed protein product [Brachionus calyciflorus]